jgi:hypothetical protein
VDDGPGVVGLVGHGAYGALGEQADGVAR